MQKINNKIILMNSMTILKWKAKKIQNLRIKLVKKKATKLKNKFLNTT
jgi:hypothetical protein